MHRLSRRALDDALRLEVELHRLHPPARLLPPRKDRLGKKGQQGGLRLRDRHARLMIRQGGEERLAHRHVFGAVDPFAPPRNVDVFDFDLL